MSPRPFLRLFVFALFALPLVVLAQNKDQEAPALTEEQILKKVTWPPEFNATVFARPPEMAYCIFLSAAPDGTLFVGCDPNGSIDRKPGVGKVLMCRDTDGDGKVDKITTFCQVDSPRGVAWDQSTRTLYVMHPPNLTAYHDDNGTGVANRQEDLIQGLGFGLDFRGADHTTNGCRLGIDGWIYIAVGDYGAVEATGKDGRKLHMRGGGIVRVRPDGTGMEQVVRGTRNILSVAISPEAEIFTRDNTNDGDDWNDRLNFDPFGAMMGYPTLFRNFPDEILPTMKDYGDGSPVGSLFLDEPSLPKGWNYGFYTVEWGRSEIDLHPLTPSGATYTPELKQFMKMTRATDLEVDGAGHLYAASWDGATFTYNGPNVGYIIRLTGKDAKPITVPDFKKLSEVELVKAVGGDSGVWRLAAQRELLVRGAKPGVSEGLQEIVKTSTNLGSRVAALYTLKLLLGEKSLPIIESFAPVPELKEYAFKVLGEDEKFAAQVPAQIFLPALDDPSPRVRLQAVTALGHLGKKEAAAQLLARTADSDYTVAHIAVQMLMRLKAYDACLEALDSADTKVQPGALRVLQSSYEPAVVDGLLHRLSGSSPELHRGITQALCRLDSKETPYTDPHMWWGTRPDTSGPIYKPLRWEDSDQIEAALKKELEAAQGADAQWLVTEVMRTKVSFPGLTDLMLSKAGSDTASRLEVIAKLISPKTPATADVLKALTAIATTTSEQPELRARAYRMLASIVEKNTSAVNDAFVSLAMADRQGPLGVVWEEYTRDTRLAHSVGDFTNLARNHDVAKRTLGATVLVNLVTNAVNKDTRSKDSAKKSIDSLWQNSEQAATLLSVIGKTHAMQFGPEVREQLNNKDHVVAEAAEYALTQLGLDKASATPAKLIGGMTYEEVFDLVQHGGDAVQGKEMFLRAGCIACHTIMPNEPPKGPILSAVAKIYDRAALTESILKPSAKIAQGFESQWFKTKKGEQIEGFVTREGGDSVDVRNIAGQAVTIEKADIVERGKRDKSIMPEGLLSAFTTTDLQNLLAWLESLRTAK
jgi:putative heme-binding domain-containing protein